MVFDLVKKRLYDFFFFSLIAGIFIRTSVWNQKRKINQISYLFEKKKQFQTFKIRTLNQLLPQLQNWNHVELKQVAEKWPCSSPWNIIVQLKHLCLTIRFYSVFLHFPFFIVVQILYSKYLVFKEIRHLNPD